MKIYVFELVKHFTVSHNFCLSFKVKVAMYKGKFTAPFKADFKIGFNAEFDRGSESW